MSPSLLAPGAGVLERIDSVRGRGGERLACSLPPSSCPEPWEMGEDGSNLPSPFPWCKTRCGGGHEPAVPLCLAVSTVAEPGALAILLGS